MARLGPVRDALEQTIRVIVPDTTAIYGSGLEPLSVFPCVIIGMPGWTPAGQMGLTVGMDRYRWPVSVVLEKPGAPDPTTVDVLEDLWTGLLDGLKDTERRNSRLGGVVTNVMLDHADFETVTVQGQEYPAQTLYVDTYL